MKNVQEQREGALPIDADYVTSTIHTTWSLGAMLLSLRNTPLVGGLPGRLLRCSPGAGAVRAKHEYAPRFKEVQKKQKGRVPVRTGGSIKGSTMQFGTYGMRLRTEGTRLTAQQLKEADNALMRYVRPLTNGQLWRRLCTNIAVCIKGNETRMGKGKGAFDHWMVRVPTGKIIFEMKGDNLHEKVAREAFRKAGSKLPGVYEFVSSETLVRVGLHGFKDPKDDQEVNYLEKLAKKPTKAFVNLQRSKDPQYRLFKGR